MSAATTPKVERLVNLTVALLDARRPRTFAELRAKTGYWSQDDADSARRMFERDKDELRRLGVPIETRPLDAFETEFGYTIDRDSYELPTVDLDADEVTALAVALRMTNRPHERLALNKLAAMAPDPAGGVADASLRVRLPADPPEVLTRAVFERRRVQFRYRPADGEVGRRDLDPYGIVRRRGRVYVVGHDHDREALRAFRVDRIVGAVTAAEEAGTFTVPDDVDLAAQASGPTSDAVTLELAVAPLATWAVEARGGRRVGEREDGWQRYVLDDVDAFRAVGWVLELVPDVVVEAPTAVRDEVVTALQRLAEA